MEKPTQDDVEEFRTDVLNDFDAAARDTRWKRGQSGNPSGRAPTPDDLDDLLVYALGKTKARALVETLIEIALNGGGQVQMRAIEYIFDRIKGKPRQSIPEPDTADPLYIQLLRAITDDSRALEGRSIAVLPTRADVTAEVREVSS